MVRKVFDVAPGRRMEYELLLPPVTPATPIPFIVSIAGSGQQQVNQFSQRPEEAPLLFDGCGAKEDGLWYLHEFCQHLSTNFAVETSRFLMAGVSNGGNAVVRFATHWPELCSGLVVVTTSVTACNENQDQDSTQFDFCISRKKKVSTLLNFHISFEPITIRLFTFSPNQANWGPLGPGTALCLSLSN